MGLVKKPKLSDIPPVPEMPKESFTSIAGDDKMFQDNTKTIAEKRAENPGYWDKRNNGISVDAIHKSTLEGQTLAQLTLGHSYAEVEEITEKYLRFNIELNRKIKGE